MNKRRRNAVIAIAAIFLVLITSGAAVVNMFGFDNIVAMINPPSTSDSSSQGFTLTDPLNETFNWNASEFEISKQGLSIQIKGIELSKEMGDLNLPALQHFGQCSGAQFDTSGNILNDYTYVKVSIAVQNLSDEKAACFLNCDISYGTLEELKKQRDKNVMTWLEAGDIPVSMTGESEYEKPEETFFIRNFEPGETREFVVGYLIDEADLKKENKFFYSISPTMMFLDYGKENPTHPSDNESSSIVTEATDNEIRYFCLNQFIEEELK